MPPALAGARKPVIKTAAIGLARVVCVKGVLITRPEPGASQTAGRIAALGLRPVLAPMLAVRAAERPLEPPARFAATVLTSGNAIPVCPPVCHERPAFAVGSATAERARAAGFRMVIDADADAAALPGLVAATIGAAGQSLFLPVGRFQGGSLSTALRARGYRVARRVAYHAAAVETFPEAAAMALKLKEIVMAMFFSAETARVFARLIRVAGLAPALADVVAVAISDRAAESLKDLPWRAVRVAARPNQDAMLVLVQ